MARRRHRPTTCTDDDCTCDLTVRSHERDPQLGTKPHEDAPVEERVCRFHGVVASY